jgi:hypothetical protein
MKISVKGLVTAASIAAIVPFSAWAGHPEDHERHEHHERHRGTPAVPTPPEAVTKECGSCHMVFPPEMLPARSWTAVMDGLANHFGENATIDDAQKKAIADWLIANAGDAPGANSHYLRGLTQSETPLRISETPYWIREHRKEVSETDFAKPNVQSKANCVACHKDAARGVWEDD